MKRSQQPRSCVFPQALLFSLEDCSILGTIEPMRARSGSRRSIMCWYSADHAEQMLEAEAGQRLVIRKIYGSSWAVSESDTQKARPTPVCLVHRTRVLFRFSGHAQPNLSSAPES